MEEHRHHSTLSPSNSMLVPYAHRHLAVSSPSRFRIPRGWGVEEVPRHDGTRSDMYYYEPGTGRKFRSIREVQRYLNGDSYPCRSTRKLSLRSHVESSGYRRMLFSGEKSSRCRRMIVSGGKLLRLDNELSQSHLAVTASQRAAPAAPFVLPDGWIVEEVPRKYDHWTDKYYYEPHTGQKFRSLVAVERYLTELEENEPLSKALEEIKENKPLSKIFKLENHAKHSSPRKKNISRENTQASSFVSPPMKVNWVLASSRGDAWNPFISEALVPDSIKQQWSNRFMLFMNDGCGNFQSS
ncbi:methyl-CpG-binding domain-containing protein 7 isoform X1 [Sesamum indicum]|uniref:Methyl-CpG-binding domain-containing protein 7 isoform X1 n=1 Tax=Sesamum indicum TaxID=4182 RepID=A0A8M8V7H1_SESIN|nr:methyl-CpG-binding domain-containing protein 7 isoform X1 [Sesamum indicum]XP_020552254.1 methyl-CpG-binding domain-containing protein 7 isoform X1 [Sesamum indicum]